MITGADVLAERTRRKLSRRAFAELVGITPTQVNNIEKGRALKPDEEAKLAPIVMEQLPENAPSAPIASAEPQGSEAGDAKVPTGVDAPGGDAWDTVSSADVVPLNVEDIVIMDDEEMEDDDDDVVTFPDPVAADLVMPRKGPVMPDVPVNVRLVSNSETATFKRCKRKWWLGWYRHLRLKHEKAGGARAIGSWVHAAMARKYVGPGEVSEDPRDALERVLTGVYTDLQTYLAEQQADRNAEFIDASVLTDFKKDADLARAMVEGYVQWVSETGADEGLTVIAPETIITAPLIIADALHYERPVHSIGKLDVRLHRDVDNVRLFMDHKTVGDFNRPMKTIHMNTQMLHYMLLELAQPDDEVVTGALYNMLRKVKRTERATPPFYQRVEVRHNPSELSNFRTHLTSTTEDMLFTELSLDEGFDHHSIVPPTPSDACSWDCDFYAVCPLFDDGSRVEDMITQLYEEVEHLDYYGVVDTEKDDSSR